MQTNTPTIYLNEHMKSRWYRGYSDTFHLPYADSMATEEAKRKIITDAEKTEFQKWHDLVKLCLSSKETFYVPTASGCYSFEYYNRNEGEYCKVRYGVLTLDKDLIQAKDFDKMGGMLHLQFGEINVKSRHSNQYVYRFGVNTHMEPPAIKLLDDGTLSMTPEMIKEEYTDFAPEAIVTTPITDIPYQSLICWGYPEKINGVRGLKDTTDYIHKFEFTPEQQKFISLCKGFYADRPHYQTAMALLHKMTTLAEFQVMRYNYAYIMQAMDQCGLNRHDAYEKVKDDLTYRYWTPDELCLNTMEKNSLETWNEMNLGISEYTAAAPEVKALLQLNEASEQKYIEDAIFADKAVEEYFYQRSHHEFYPIYEKPAESKIWSDRSKNMWTKGNIDHLRYETSVVLDERIHGPQPEKHIPISGIPKPAPNPKLKQGFIGMKKQPGSLNSEPTKQLTANLEQRFESTVSYGNNTNIRHESSENKAMKFEPTVKYYDESDKIADKKHKKKKNRTDHDYR